LLYYWAPAAFVCQGGAIDQTGRFSILIVDARELIHRGVCSLLGAQPWVERCLAAMSADDAVRLVGEHRPHVALVGAVVGEAPGLEVCGRLRDASPETSVVLMADAGRISAAGARSAGASGYVSTSWSGEDIADVLRVVARGVTVFAPDSHPSGGSLSQREMEVLRLLASGATNREIAARLYLSPHTVKGHTTALYRKVKARNRAEALVRAQRLGLLV
jgi:DNA-binding NarL/FixJ family response regulator